jgi:hypothetical protein
LTQRQVSNHDLTHRNEAEGQLPHHGWPEDTKVEKECPKPSPEPDPTDRTDRSDPSD